MADRPYRVELSASFLARLQVIETFLTEADAAPAYDQLLADLRATVIPNLRRFPRMGRPYLGQAPRSTEALAQLAALPGGAAGRLREYLHGDYLILYTVAPADPLLHLLSIRHHREISFLFDRLWPGAGGPPPFNAP